MASSTRRRCCSTSTASRRNVERLSTAIAAGGKDWRPHSKGHKSPWIARRQMELGAIGVTCAKVSEAEVMVDGGIPSILVANELATRIKVERAARLQDRAEVIICADDPFHVRLGLRGRRRGRGRHPDGRRHQRRDGPDRRRRRVRPALELARPIDRAPGVRLAGIMGYEGHTLTAWPNEEKRAETIEAIAGLVESRRLIEADGMPVGIVSGGGSGNHMFAASLDGLTELQAGGACFMDPFYGELCHLEELGFEYALTILTTVTSRPTAGAGHHRRRVQDAVGQGGMARQSSSGTTEFELDYLSAEHGVWLRPPDGPSPWRSASSSRSSRTTTTRRRSATTRSSACAMAWSRRSSRSSAAAS